MTAKPIILASASPRRHEILTKGGIVHTVITSDADEKSVVYRRGFALDYVTDVAELKNRAVCAVLPTEKEKEENTVLSADTIVVVGEGESEEILGKPENNADAARMLRLLSGSTHRVITGVVITRGENITKFAEVTRVTFREMTDDEIDAYIATGSPLDKAGAYGIQDPELHDIVVRVEGDYDNVVGLPLIRVAEEVKFY